MVTTVLQQVGTAATPSCLIISVKPTNHHGLAKTDTTFKLGMYRISGGIQFWLDIWQLFTIQFRLLTIKKLHNGTG